MSRLVSDALGRERAIEIVRKVLDEERDNPWDSNDGRALKIVLALDSAGKESPPPKLAPNDTCPTCGLLGSTLTALNRCGLKREPGEDETCLIRN